ncbi:MAG: hypothetical protein C0412_14680, partial [Flavobacterium sp.]|nr:hypothetical protein [Flavobacterium sp.]
VRGAKLNAQSDLFSAGVVLYEMFTGKNPFLKENVSLTLNEIMAFDEGLVSKGLDEQEQSIKDVIYHLIRKNVKDRYSTALEALTDFGVSVDQPTLVIKTEEAREQKNRIKAVAAITTVVVIIVFFVLLKLFDSSPPATNPNISFGDSTAQQNQKSNLQNDISPNGKDIIDTSNLNKPLLENQAIPNTTQTELDGNSLTQQPIKNLGDGWLNILAVVGTRVIINGENYGPAISRPIPLTEGEYNVKLENDEYPLPYTEKVKINAKQATTLRVNFNSMFGFVTFDVRPESKIYIDGSLRGETPPVLRMVRLTPGMRRVSLKNPNYRDLDTTLNIEKGDTLKFSYKFKR